MQVPLVYKKRQCQIIIENLLFTDIWKDMTTEVQSSFATTRTVIAHVRMLNFSYTVHKGFQRSDDFIFFSKKTLFL